MCLNGTTCRRTHQVKKVKERQWSLIIFCLSNVIYYVYECFDQYCKLASIVTRDATFATVMIGFPLIARDEIPVLKCLR